VAEGRDIGAVVWPEAELKVWLDADPAVRAKRRGGEGEAALERDRRDAAQTIVPEGSARIDTTGLSVDEVVDRIEELVR
jgi:cytidylate kinase